MRHKEHGGLLLAKLLEFANTPVGENRVADGQRLIHNQNIGIHMDGGGKSQTHIHAAGVLFYRPADELADLREGFDGGEVSFHLGARNAHDFAVDENVFPAGEFRVETGAQFEERGHPSAFHNPARGGRQNAADHLQERAFAASVGAHQADHLAALHTEGHVAQRPEIRVQGRFAEDVEFPNAVEWPAVKPVKFGNVLNENQTSSLMSRRSKTNNHRQAAARVRRPDACDVERELISRAQRRQAKTVHHLRSCGAGVG